jgi:hypothetical protein
VSISLADHAIDVLLSAVAKCLNAAAGALLLDPTLQGQITPFTDLRTRIWHVANRMGKREGRKEGKKKKEE